MDFHKLIFKWRFDGFLGASLEVKKSFNCWRLVPCAVVPIASLPPPLCSVEADVLC